MCPRTVPSGAPREGARGAEPTIGTQMAGKYISSLPPLVGGQQVTEKLYQATFASFLLFEWQLFSFPSIFRVR